jgi:hypothetical protein
MKKIYLLLALCLAIQGNIFAQLTGTKTIKTSGGNYSSFTEAFADLNTNGVGDGGVIFNVDAGATFYEANIYINTPTASASRQIKFQKSGSGANPVIYGKSVGGTSMDFLIGIGATDYVTFDGIDIKSDPTAVLDADKIEFGLVIYDYMNKGCNGITIKNCNITINPIASTSAVQQNGILITQAAGSASGIHSNILLDNVTFLQGRNSISIFGQTIPSENIEVKNCHFGEASATVISPLDLDCVVKTDKCQNFSFHDNEIQNISSSNFYVLRMINFAGENNIYNNRIHKLRSTATEETAGMSVFLLNSVDPSAELNIYNNLIYDYDGARGTSSISSPLYWNLLAFQINGTSKYRILNNTVIGSSVNEHESSIFCYSTSTNVEIKNNIFADFSIHGAYSFRTIFVSDGVIENNLFWLDETLANNYTYKSGTVSYKFKELQKGSTKPSPGYFLNNMMANPNFTDRAGFNFTPKSPTPASNNGQPDAYVASSLNGVARNATTPDIGAFEGDFGAAMDLLPPVIRFQPLAYVLSGETKLTADITDNTGVTVAKLWFRDKGSVSAFSQVAGVKFGNVWNFTFPALSPGMYEYFVCAKDAANNVISNGYIVSGLNATNTGLDVNDPPANPDYVYSFSYGQTLVGGTYTVGTGGNYTSFTKPDGLFNAMNSLLITGNIDATIISDLDETGEIKLNQWQEYGAGNYTLTIKPNNTTLRTITNNTLNPINIEGADRVTIDGSSGGDNLNHIKFVANITNPIKFTSSGSNGCNTITVKFCDVSSISWAGIVVSGTNNTDFLIENVNLLKGYSGISLSNAIRPIVRNCVFGSTDILNTLTNYGIYLDGCSDVLVEKNTFQNIINSTDTYGSYGIYGINSTGGSIINNKITDVKNNAAIGNGISNGVCLASSTNLTVANNIISGINGNGGLYANSTFGIKGAVLVSCNNVKFYYNTINLFGTGNTVIDAISYSFSTENSTNLEIRNNIFSNTMDDANPSNASYAAGVVQFNNDLSNIFSNNIHFVGGTSASTPFSIINDGGSMDLKTWQSKGFIPGNGRDLGSGVGDPYFAGSGTHDVSLLASSPALNSGKPLSVVTDFYGNPRNSTTPDIGAIEDNSLTLTTDVVAPIIDYVPFTDTQSTTPTFSATITDNIGVTAAKMWYRDKGSSVDFTGITGINSSGNTWNFTVTSALTPNSEYEYFICAKDGLNNIITNGITNSALNPATVGLAVNNPAAAPDFVRSFKVSDNIITLGTITGAPFYVSGTKTATVNVPYTAAGTYSSNTFTAHLSDATGNFAFEITIGSLGSNTSGTINATIPAVATGSGYKIRVKSSNPAGIISNESPAFQIIYDNIAPLVSLTSSATSPATLPFTVTIEFNETVQGFAQNMITVTNANLSSFNTVISDKKFTVLVSPINTGLVTVKVEADKVKDYADNFNAESNTLSLSYIELDVPHLNIAAAGDVYYFNTSPLELTFTFDQDVTGFTGGDIGVTTGSVTNFTPVSAKVYTADLNPSAQGELVVTVADDVAINGSGAGNSSSSLNLFFDDQQPDVTVSRTSGSGYVTGMFNVTITFSEEVTGFDINDITKTGATLSNFTGSGSVYQVDVTPVAVGDVLISVPQNVAQEIAGNFNLASNELVTVYKATLTATADNKTKVYGAANPVFTITYSGWVNGVETIDTPPTASTTVNGTTVVGNYTGAITLSGGEDDHYIFTYAAGNFEVTKATLTVTADPKTKIYGAANPPLTFTYSGWVNGVETIDTPPTASTTVTTTTVVSVNAGAITLSGGVDNNYLFSYIAGNFTVNKATLTVTADFQTKVYGAANPPLTFTYTGWVNGVETIDTPPTASTTVTTTTAVGLNAGAITVAGGLDNNYLFNYVGGDFDVTKATLTVTADAKTKVYGAANPPLTFTYNGWVNGVETIDTPPTASTTVTTATAAGPNAGAITLSGGLDNNYLFNYAAGDFTVTKATLIVTADNKTKVYGAVNPALTFTYAGWVNGVETIDTPPIASTTVAGTTAVGDYPGAITVAAGLDNNYLFTYVAGDFTVTKATLTVTADAKTKAYGAANPALTFTYSNWVNGVETIDTPPTISTTVDATTGAGIHAGAIFVAGGLDNNYLFSYVAGDFTINKATLTVTADALTKVYGAANPALTFSYSGWVNGVETIDTPPIASTTVDATSAVGPYVGAITLAGGLDNNYMFNYVAGNFTVTKASLIVTADNKTKIYGEANPALTFTYSGWVNGVETIDTPPTVSTTVSGTTAVGVYAGAITVAGGTDNNYLFSYVGGTFEILPKEIIITPTTGQSKLVGDPDPVFTYTNSEWANNTNFTGALGREAGEAIGNYAFTLGDLSAGSNYSLVMVVTPPTFAISVSTGIEDPQSNDKLTLMNYPNPFDKYTTINYTLPFDGRVTLTIRNLGGQLVKTVVSEMQTTGEYSVNIEEWGPQSGIYMVILRLKSDDRDIFQTLKMVKGR